MACVKKDIYLNLYNEYKQILANKTVNKWANYSMPIKSEMAEKINIYVGSEK